MSALGDVIVDSLQELLRVLFTPITNLIQTHANSLVSLIVGTPHPNAVFSRPTNGAWPNIYDYYWDGIVPLALFLWALAIGLVIFLESTSHLFSSYHRSKLKKRALSGLLGILAWWWIAALSLRFIEALTGYIVPDLSSITLFQTLSFAAMGVLGLVIALASDFLLFVLLIILYFTRHLVLYLFVLLMPLLIVFWIPGVGPFSLVSRFMRRLAGFYVPFLFMTVPVAILFRVGDLMGQSFSLSMGGFGAWLTALIMPIVAVLCPLVLFWQAGAIFFVTDRAARHASTPRAQDRTARARETGQASVLGSRNFLRGAGGKPAIRGNGQTVLNSGNSRAHVAGARLNASGSRLRDRFKRQNRRGGNGGTAATGSERAEFSRAANFENLQNRTATRTSDGTSRGSRTDRDDDPPRYIQ
ncbi:hypothetical protein [Haloplanus aerogenes]|uniref:Type IV secretion system protein TrbL n=1 Tax=Haloplanus aerogenes TaxID=660522 RepID=A0A3M0CFG5_9EURY|nr:hypothetical protein [Haloplanus aerogenes]AZH24795.1 hypothetical protein DU502_05130 [Haloplanus aerogenes]RMB08334.1 hypothetical protein ATH50_3549 [Haloplanus aerogenes]